MLAGCRESNKMLSMRIIEGDLVTAIQREYDDDNTEWTEWVEKIRHLVSEECY